MSHSPSVFPWKGCLAKEQLDVDKAIALGVGSSKKTEHWTNMERNLSAS